MFQCFCDGFGNKVPIIVLDEYHLFMCPDTQCSVNIEFPAPPAEQVVLHSLTLIYKTATQVYLSIDSISLCV